ncbi:hypothetical protein [Microbacterium sp. E-13]|uniref:hypothetical protein n=1 Tax=Microbacterium sp. E-13 TaxID=3404048 RepID=UPI003CEE2EA5
MPPIEPVGVLSVGIDSDTAGFTVTNTSASDLSVLITLMARARGADAATARERLVAVTSPESHDDVLRVADVADETAYARLWHDDVEVHAHRRGGFTATRSGALVVPLPAGATFRLGHDPAALRDGVVVAAVAAAGDGLDGPLVPVDRGPAASIGEKPEIPSQTVSPPRPSAVSGDGVDGPRQGTDATCPPSDAALEPARYGVDDVGSREQQVLTRGPDAAADHVHAFAPVAAPEGVDPEVGAVRP